MIICVHDHEQNIFHLKTTFLQIAEFFHQNLRTLEKSKSNNLKMN